MPIRDLISAMPFDAQASADRHARQMRVGFDTLRFEQGLETEYRAALLVEAQAPAYVLNLAAAIIWGGFAVFDFIRLDVMRAWPLEPDLWLLLGSRWLVLALLVLGLVPRLASRVPLDIRAFVIYLMIGFSASLTSVLYRANGMESLQTMQIVVVMSAFVPMGLRFYGALAASVSVVLLAILFGALILPPESNREQMALVAVMLLALAISAVGGYLRELAHRRQFLLAALLSHQAQFDSLTNLANRRLFERHASAALAHAHRSDEPVTLAVIDIDHFKRFNDHHGHAAGDEALRAVADSIADFARRPMDMAARLGGEEFALLLFGTDPERAAPILETLRQRVSHLDLGGRTLTISIGAANADMDGLDALYRRADDLLYRSKENGRNRLSLAS